MHVTAGMAAEFYKVERETIATLVKRNRDEFEDDGYRVVTRGAFEETFKMNVPSSASRIALFPRRAVLRLGMLLRDVRALSFSHAVLRVQVSSSDWRADVEG